ncbi:MATE family efflux transporter [Elongatibacter sediminis]|uniref:Multidrug-efflux transporter n=1 Tax=Elongatibacter sediminis TaxID=3119006 RepID=A0AAW9RB17_9GAMM
MTSITKAHNHLAEIRRTVQLAAPVVIGQVAVFSMNFVDTVMAGRLPDRDVSLAALGIGGAVWSALLMFTIGLLLSVQPNVAQLDGAKRWDEATGVVRQGGWLALMVAVPFWLICYYSAEILTALRIDPVIVPVAADYLRAMSWGVPAICGVFLLRFFSEGSGHTRPTMLYGVAGVMMNIPLNWVLMFGKFGAPALGTTGCGYATAIVLWAQLLMLLVYVQKHRHFRRYDLFSRFELPHWGRILDLVKLGTPIAISVFLEGSLFAGAALLIGRLGPLPAAGHMIAINFAALAFMIPLGLSSAVTVRVGNAIGRGDPVFARYVGLIGIAVVLGTQTFSMSLMVLFPQAIVALYTQDAAVTAIAIELLVFAAVFQMPDGIQICAAGALRGIKDTRVPMFYNLVAYWMVGMSLGYYLTFHREWGPSGMWMGMIAGLSLGSVLLLTRFLVRTRRLIRDG